MSDNKDRETLKLLEHKFKREFENGNSPWNLLQELMQEVMAGFIIADPDKSPKIPKMVEALKKKIEEQYSDEEELRDFLLMRIPTNQAIGLWFKRKGWNEAVWEKIRTGDLFSQEKRSMMINSLFQRGMEKDTTAAKIWLTLSGDYVEKMDVGKNDKAQDIYREINELLHNKKDK